MLLVNTEDRGAGVEIGATEIVLHCGILATSNARPRHGGGDWGSWVPKRRTTHRYPEISLI
jgi:hypothetical protein